MMQHLPTFHRFFMLVSLIFLASCQSTYYSAMEKVGIHKRDILVDRVEKARDAQTETREQFKSALEQFNTVLGIKGGALQEKYDQLNSAFEKSESQAEEVRDRIKAVESVAEDLFDEWEEELTLYTNQSLRNASAQKLRQTRQHYTKLINAMHRAESRIDPVLDIFQDQVLFLKHNLNAQAIASLKNELGTIENRVARLIREMESSINEANRFVDSMKNQ